MKTVKEILEEHKKKHKTDNNISLFNTKNKKDDPAGINNGLQKTYKLRSDDS